ncbi:MAG: glutamine-hydrolyzing GMP synthase [Rhodospirillaceae bacterium]|nr:glutamine-hydrolyzing GMP synthase [Rhodospirillaceae bacterium]
MAPMRRPPLSVMRTRMTKALTEKQADKGAGTENRILVIDFGSQVTQLIARRLRESGVYTEIVPYSSSEKKLTTFKPRGIILSGGPSSVTSERAPSVPNAIFESGLPILGICYGQQIMCAQLGGEIQAANEREFGLAQISVLATCKLFDEIWKAGTHADVWMSHGDKVTALPNGFKAVAKSDGTPYAAIADEKRQLYGLQFHPEVVHTPEGGALLRSFALNIAKCSGTWSMKSFRDEAIRAIRAKVGKAKVICGLSGGVDSSVTAVLIHEAIGDQLTCVLVDHGLLRTAEAKTVVELFEKEFNIRLIHKDASDLFLTKLDGVTDPEQKRKIIGNTFIDVFEDEANKITGAEFLAQGTLYPDVIESVPVAGGPSKTIKSHHNVGGLPERMQLKLLEPLRELFKDEVRILGNELNIPSNLVGRHPFPGPGLAIRIPGAISAEKLSILRAADDIYLQEIENFGIYNEIWQAFCVLLPVKTVGVMGDSRTYEFVCALRAVTSEDGMTADYYPFGHDFLSTVARRIVNEVKGINRVTYDITSKPPGTVEWE